MLGKITIGQIKNGDKVLFPCTPFAMKINSELHFVVENENEEIIAVSVTDGTVFGGNSYDNVLDLISDLEDEGESYTFVNVLIEQN